MCKGSQSYIILFFCVVLFFIFWALNACYQKKHYTQWTSNWEIYSIHHSSARLYLCFELCMRKKGWNCLFFCVEDVAVVDNAVKIAATTLKLTLHFSCYLRTTTSFRTAKGCWEMAKLSALLPAESVTLQHTHPYTNTHTHTHTQENEVWMM